jgi:hypothetical protein
MLAAEPPRAFYNSIGTVGSVQRAVSLQLTAGVESIQGFRLQLFHLE